MTSMRNTLVEARKTCSFEADRTKRGMMVCWEVSRHMDRNWREVAWRRSWKREIERGKGGGQTLGPISLAFCNWTTTRRGNIVGSGLFHEAQPRNNGGIRTGLINCEEGRALVDLAVRPPRRRPVLYPTSVP